MSAVLVASARLQRDTHMYSGRRSSAASCLVSSTYPPSIPRTRVAFIFWPAGLNMLLQQYDTAFTLK